MKKVKYDSKPTAIKAVGNGSYLYRWGIEEIAESAVTEQGAYTSWSCFEVVVWNTPTENSITEQVVNFIWGSGVEQKLLNDYQAAQLGILDASYSLLYTTFLTERKAIKQQIKEDFAEWNDNKK
ncbi:MAG: hypothetical protein R3Y26_08370 [Rikenellaceae bacterium]